MKTFKDRPILTIGLSTDEEVSLDLSTEPPVCAVHRSEIGVDEEQLLMTVEHPLVDGPRTVAICQSCLSEHAPKALALLTA